MTAPPRVLSGARLSELAACPRRCACRIAGHEAAAPGSSSERYLRRGRLFQMYVQAQFEARYGPDDIEAERPISWGNAWTGHADLYVRSQKLLIEVVSTVGGNVDHKIRQALFYLLHDTEAEHAAVYVVDPSTLEREDLFPVFLTEETRLALEELVRMMQAVDAGGELPACAHATPIACRYSGCPFWGSSWEGWLPPDPVDISDTPGLISLTADYWRAMKEREARKAELEESDRRYRDAKDALAELLVLPKTPYRVGPFEASRTHVSGRETFSYARARESGAITPAMADALQPFVKIGEGHDRINLRRISDELVPADWGEVPF